MCLVGVVVRRYINFLILYTYPYSSCICSFLQQHPYFLFVFKNVFRSLCQRMNCYSSQLGITIFIFGPQINKANTITKGCFTLQIAYIYTT